jgi:hypothetical protein
MSQPPHYKKSTSNVRVSGYQLTWRWSRSRFSSPLCVPLSRKFGTSLETFLRTPRMVSLTRHFSRSRRSRKTRCRRGTILILITVKENILSNRNRRLRRLIPDSLRNRNRRRNTRSRRRKRHNYTPSTFATGGVGAAPETTPPKAPFPQSSSSPRGTSARRAMGTSTIPAETTTATTHKRSKCIAVFIFL